MGTRGLLGHITRRQRKGAYNQWDSYPSNLGVKLVKFIRSLSDEQIEKMIEMLDNIEWVNRDDEAPASVQYRYIALKFADFGVSNQSPTDWYCLLNKVQGADAFPRVLDGTLKHLIEETDFEHDGLFCEWMYMVDWVKKEVYVRVMWNNGVEKTLTFAELTEEKMLELEVRGRDKVEEEEEIEEDFVKKDVAGKNEESDESDINDERETTEKAHDDSKSG